MSKADYPYPEDEFDAISPDAPTGVHRAPRSAWSRWWPFVVVLLVVPVLAYGTVTYLSRTGGTPVGGAPQGQQEPPPEAPADGGTAEDPTVGEGEQPPPEPTTPAAEPVLSTPVSVLNGARVSGLASRVADELEAAGFTSVSPDNANGDLPDESTVFITSEDLRATADLVATTVGVPTIVVSPPDAGGGVTVVLVTDPDA